MTAPQTPADTLREATDGSDHVCPTCGYVMCQMFDDVPLTGLATLASPNGRFICYHCDPPRPKTEDMITAVEAAIQSDYFASVSSHVVKQWLRALVQRIKAAEDERDAIKGQAIQALQFGYRAGYTDSEEHAHYGEGSREVVEAWQKREVRRG